MFLSKSAAARSSVYNPRFLASKAFVRLPFGERTHRYLSSVGISKNLNRGLMTSIPSSSSGEPSTTGTIPRTQNRLSKEQSPYLLQHQYNPVDWYSWSPEALEKAKREDKPIFLSVGYSTCHWCHVMEHESFERQETAELMNKSFVNIKVDREERPDVDRVYMTYVQAISGRGGWPMSVWLTPELEPIYGGTYYPQKDMVQAGMLLMPSFNTVLRRIADLWSKNKDDLKSKGTAVMSQLSQALESEVTASGDEGALRADAVEAALTLCSAQLGKRFDAERGGFGGAPKFPRPCEINALLCASVWLKGRGDEEQAAQILNMANFSLKKMAAGGMYDHIGGGFHRYSVDEYWHVPHFEKMLYDNPQLVNTYLMGFQVTGDMEHAMVARGVLDYLRRDMMSPEGGLYSAEDADSLDPVSNHKSEGFFYVWSADEINQVLTPDEARLFNDAYSIREMGNCTLSARSDPHKEFVGRNVPILLESMEEVAKQNHLPVEQLQAILAECRAKLHAARAKRPRPGLDDKIVTSWNGWGISAFSRAARVLSAEKTAVQPCFPVDGVDRRSYLQCAEQVAAFVSKHLWDEERNVLRRSYRVAPSSVEGFADDYACLIMGLLDLYEAGGNTGWLEFAARLQRRMDELFWDTEAGGYYSTTTADPSIKLRIKDEYDGAEPTAGSIAAANLQRLAALLPRSDSAAEQFDSASFTEKAETVLTTLQGAQGQLPLVLPQMCCSGFLRLTSPFKQVIVAQGPAGASPHAVEALLDAVHAPFAPNKAVLTINLADAGSVEFWRKNSPEALAMAETHFQKHSGAGPTAFICQNFTCQAPSGSPEEVVRLLAQGVVPSGPRIRTEQNLPGM